MKKRYLSSATITRVALLWLATSGFAAGAATSVLDAVALKDKAGLRSLLKNGADVNAAMGDGLTAIHQVAIDGDAEIAQLLIYAGANLKATTRLGGYTPLLLAAKNGDAAMIDTLLKGGADPNQATTNGTSPLMFAAASGNGVAVRLLLDKGADVAAKERAMGQTALMFAAANGRADVVKTLIGRGGDIKGATKVVDLNAFTKEAEEAFAAAVAGGAPPKPPEGTVKPEDAAAATEAAKAAGLGGATTMSSEVPAAAKASEARASKAPAPPMKDAAPRVALAPPAARPTEAAPAPDAKTPKPPVPTAAPEAPTAPAKAAEAAKPKKPQVPGVDRNFLYNELVGATGGMTPLLFAVRQGHKETVAALIEAGADVNLASGADKTSPLLLATINGQFDLALYLLERGANPNLASDSGVTPLYAAVNVQWAPKALYPQPRAYMQQKASYLDLMKALLEKGAAVDVRLKKKVWYQGYNFDLSGVDETGATPFWRAAYASDVDAMKLLVAHGADPSVRTMKSAGRPPTGDGRRDVKDVSGLPPVPVGGPAITALQAAAGVGYGEGFAANSHRFAPGGMLAAVKYLVEELHADVNVADHEGNTALHHAAARGDNEMIKYLVSKGANVMAVTREGQTTVDMANAPVQRVEPFPATIALLEGLGAKNNHKCVSCDTGVAKTTGNR